MIYQKGLQTCDTLGRARVRPLTDVETDAESDEVATPVTTMPSVAGVRPLGSPPSRGPVVTVPAVREADGLPVRLIMVTAELDATLRRRIRTESADLEAALSRLPSAIVLPLVDHGLDPDGRPFLIAAMPGPSVHEVLATEGPRPLDEVLAVARAAAEGLRTLAGQGLVGPPPEVCHTGDRRLTLATPLPPVLTELESALGDGTGHEPPEVLSGADWAPSGQTYACASMLWTLLSGRPPYIGQDRKLARLVGGPPAAFERTGVPDAVIAVLRSALAVDPADRPADPGALAATLEESAEHVSNPTLPPAPSKAWALGSRYELHRRIGGGASGQVWAGRRRDDDLPVAVKVLRRELSEDPQTVDRFLRESRLLQSVQHPNIVRIHDFVKEAEVFGIVMELIDGSDLRDVTTRGPLTVSDAAGLLAQTASALAAVHADGIVHRDVKPENVLVTERDGRLTAYLSDFGIARAIAGSAHTQLLGTPAYLGPELWAGRAPTAATDVYALGVTAYELLAGRLPFDGPSQEAIMRAHLERTVSRPPGLDETAWALIEECLARDPAHRPDAARVAARWAAMAGPGVLGGLTIPPSSAVAPPPPSRELAHDDERDPATGTVMSARALPVRPAPQPVRRRRRRGPILVISAVAVLGIGGGVALAMSQRSTPPPARPAASPKTGYYVVPASIAISGATTAKVSWGSQAGSMPGFAGYVVTDASVGNRPVSRVLPKDVTSYAVHDLRAGRQACFLVIAVVTAPPPGPPAQPTCVTPPAARRPTPRKS